MPPTLDEVRQLPRCHEEVIPASYLDAMDHMNVMWYTHLFSQGLQALFAQIGFKPQYIRDEQIGTFALEKHVRYHAEVRVDQQAAVYVRLVDRSEKLVHVNVFVVNESTDRLAATLETINACVDLAKRATTPIPAPISDELDRLLAEHQRLQWAPSLCGAMGLRSGRS